MARSGAIPRGARVLAQYVRIGWIRKSQFRWEFFNQVLMDVVFYASFILTFEFIYGLDEGLTLAGWTRPEVRVYLGMAFIADAIWMTFLGQQWHFGADLKDGKLDPFRVKPGSTAFLYFFQRFSPEGLTNLAIAGGWLVFALGGMASEPGAVQWWLLPAAVASIAWTQVVLAVAYSTTELYVLNSGVGHLFAHMLSSMAERPIDVYPPGIRRVLMFVVPLAGTCWYPASLVLGRLDLAFAAGYPAVLLAFGWVTSAVFRRGLRRYESAMG